MKKETITTPMIAERLMTRYNHNTIRITNAYVWKWECDFFTISGTGISYEIEIKISRGDFLKEARKFEKIRQIETGQGPNRFFFAAPAGMIQKHELPQYAGLIEIHPERWVDTRVIKPAPLIHKEKFKDWQYLATKFCERMHQWRYKTRISHEDLRIYEKRVADLRQELADERRAAQELRTAIEEYRHKPGAGDRALETKLQTNSIK